MSETGTRRIAGAKNTYYAAETAYPAPENHGNISAELLTLMADAAYTAAHAERPDRFKVQRVRVVVELETEDSR